MILKKESPEFEEMVQEIYVPMVAGIEELPIEMKIATGRLMIEILGEVCTRIYENYIKGK